MYFYIKYIAEALAFPPGINIMLTLLGLLLWRRHKRSAVALIVIAVLSLLIFSLPYTAITLMSSLQTTPPLHAEHLEKTPAQAIVILGGGIHRAAPEYGGETISRYTLERLRYAAHLHRQTGLPILVSGGIILNQQHSEAALMKKALEEEFDIRVPWLEERSTTTWENAVNTAALLHSLGIEQTYVVTHAWHMRRALWAFKPTGLKVIPAPTSYVNAGGWSALQRTLPNARALEINTLALHELLGLAWYRINH